ncbi:uncharacterized protein LOC128956147 [Oppia nitens]|uniref:uncharacterized protein LOC128956147 n=1 Tax=Oppia nitens TaxID=1686743 RepID=UPI0023DB2379|nr:uncharacterized protein LOC128956147 [Oppia nitens]
MNAAIVGGEVLGKVLSDILRDISDKKDKEETQTMIEVNRLKEMQQMERQRFSDLYTMAGQQIHDQKKHNKKMYDNTVGLVKLVVDGQSDTRRLMANQSQQYSDALIQVGKQHTQSLELIQIDNTGWRQLHLD